MPGLIPDRRKPGEVVRDLSPRDWLHKCGTVEGRRVAEDAATSYEHLKHIVHGRRRPSVDLARRLVLASGGGMSLTKLLGVDEAALPKARPHRKSRTTRREAA